MTGWCLHFAWLCLTTTFFASTGTGDSCRPSFGYESFQNIGEDTKVGNVLLIVDTGNDSVLSVETDLSTTPFDFDNQTRALSLQKTLDSDYSEQTFRISFKCKLQGLPDSAATIIRVTISVTDVNDNPPVFTQCCYNLSLGEMTRVNTTFSTNMRATDADKDYSNNAIYYSILPGPYSNYFSLPDRMKISELRLVRQVDYESVTSMTITILAVNDMSDIRLNSTADLTITIVDEDDQNPVFNQTIYQGYVRENFPRGTIVTITPPMFAYDADKTINSPVTYSFHDGQELLNGFQINRTTAEVRVEFPVSASTVSLVVQATQVDNPTRYGVAMLVVTVQGASLSAPQFLQSTFFAQVSEDSPVGTQVLMVVATDNDFGAQIKYSILNSSVPFNIGSDSGVITLSGFLDYETKSQYFFIVSASDGVKNSQATANISVIDINDNTPSIISKNLSFHVAREKGALVTTLQAEDKDANTKLSFALQNYKGLFSINDFGVIQVAAEPSNLTDNFYNLLVEVSDNGRPPRSSFAVVMVDFSPTFLQSSSLPPEVATSEFKSVTIALVVVAAILLVTIIILIVFICKRRRRDREHLDKPKLTRSPDPKGLTFKQPKRGAFQPMDICSQLEHQLDGTTPGQDDPHNTGGALNHGFVQDDDGEVDRDMGEIQIETAVIPYGGDHPSNIFYHQEDSSEYDDTLPSKHSIMNGLYTHVDSIGSGSLRSALSDGSDDYDYNPVNPDGQDRRSHSSDYAMPLESLDPAVSVQPREEKQELTVYF